MRIQFCGADRTVTGSCHQLEVNGLRLFLDMGMYQGARDEAREINQWLPDAAKSADGLILSHGHLDHCGKIPLLTRAGYAGPIYCTPATAEVARVVMTDAAEIQVEDADYLNRRVKSADQPQIRPLYEPSDIPAVMKLIRRTPYGQRVDLGKGVSFTFLDAGHILGSAYVMVEWDSAVASCELPVASTARAPALATGNSQLATPRRRLLFTADVGRFGTPILRDPHPVPGSVDYIITESTYGGRLHGPMADVGPQLLDCIRYCIQHRSRLLVPSFAVGRTQTILWYVQRFIQQNQIPPIPLYVDSPMGVEISHIHSDFRDNFDDETNQAIGQGDLFGTSRVTFASSVKDSQKINSDSGPCVIIASSPTCEFGRILHHLHQSIERPNDMVLFVGWTPPNTLGRRLQDGQKRVKIFDRWYEVKCQVRTIHGLSAHADSDELLRFLRPALTPATDIYIVHGEPDQAEQLAARLLKQGAATTIVPAMKTSALMPGFVGGPARELERAKEPQRDE